MNFGKGLLSVLRAFSKSGRHSRAGGNPAPLLPIPLDSRFRGSDDFSSPITLDDTLKRPWSVLPNDCEGL